MVPKEVLDRVQIAIDVCQSRRTLYNRLFLLMESLDGKHITKGIVDKVEAEIPGYRADYIFSKGYEKAVTFYPKNGKAAYTSLRFRLVYLPHHEKVHFESFKEEYGSQRDFNMVRLMQLKAFQADAETGLKRIAKTLKAVRRVTGVAKSILHEYRYMTDLLDERDKQTIKGMAEIA